MNKSCRKKLLIFITFLVVVTGGFLFYDAKEPFVKPIFARQINQDCPYYKDFLGRLYHQSAYKPSSLFIIGNTNETKYYWHRVKGIDNRNVQVVRGGLNNLCFAIDGNNLVYRNYVFGGADIESFEELENGYYKDFNKVYFSNGKLIQGADPKTFEVLFTSKCFNTQPPYAKDSAHVYYAQNVIDQADAATFKLTCIGEDVRGQDKDNIYEGTEIITD